MRQDAPVERDAALRASRWTLLALLALAAVALTLHSLADTAPVDQWRAILAGRHPDTVRALVFTQVDLPRLAASWIVGAALGLAGVLFQQALRNPLADPATLGVSSGAFLAMAAATLYAPALLAWSAEAVAMAGALAACVLVMALAWRSRFSTIHVILAGLVVSLFCSAAAAALTLLNHEYLGSLFVWQTGSLVQNGWQKVWRLLPQCLLLAACTFAFARPLNLLALDDARAGSLGLRAPRMRAVAVALGVGLSALSVAWVGVIGFIGLMAPHLARMAGARTLRQRLMAAPALGALLLWTADQCVQWLGRTAASIPTGSASALIGSPVLLWLLFRQRGGLGVHPAPGAGRTSVLAAPPGGNILPALALCALACAAILYTGLFLGRDAHGWSFARAADWHIVHDWRLPRVGAAASAGAMIAIAGTLLQRLTGNPLASPEVLGVSSGAALGVIAVLLFTADVNAPGMLAAAGAGALATLAAIIALNWRSGFSPQRLLLAGVALSTLLTACASFLLVRADPRALALLTWMSGSTYRATNAGLLPGLSLLVLGCTAVVAGHRWLDVLPLGDTATRALGVPVLQVRLMLLIVIALLTAGATIVVGPLSFVGLLAPHIVRGLGLQRPRAALAGAVLVGAAIMVLADWLGRMIVFPWQIPAGLIAMLAGGPSFLWFLWRNK